MSTLLDPRFKDSYSRRAAAKTMAIINLTSLVESSTIAPAAEVVIEPELNNNCEGLFGALSAVRKKSRLEVNRTGNSSTAESVIKDYLSSELESSRSLSWWSKYEAMAEGNNIKLALCKLARKYLTPPPTSTNCERLFSVAGMVMDEKRANLLPENLDMILFFKGKSCKQ